MIHRRSLLGLLAAGLAATPALAHRLTVFAFVEGGEVVVEAKFSSGRRPVSGTVRIRGGDEALLATYDLGAEGVLRVPLAELDASGGLMIEVETGEGHSDYWILTPEDIQGAGADG